MPGGPNIPNDREGYVTNVSDVHGADIVQEKQYSITTA